MSPGIPHMGYTYLNLLDSPELLQILVTLTAVIKPLLPNFLGRAIVILNFIRRFRNFIADSALVEQEAHGPRLAHLSDTVTADMQMLCNIFPIL